MSIDHLMQMNLALMDKLAAHTAAPVTHSPATPAPTPAPKPFKDCIPKLSPHKGDGVVTLEAFLAQYLLHVQQNQEPPEERPCHWQLSAAHRRRPELVYPHVLPQPSGGY